MDHYSYVSQGSTNYSSTAYQPVDTRATPHITYHEGTKTDGFGPGASPEVIIDGRSRPLGFRSLRWWWPELLATLVSVASFIAIVIVVRHYRGQGLQDVHLPSQLNLNGLVALLSTVCRIALMIPVGSALSQEVWTWFYGARSGIHRRQLRDLELSDEASRSAWGSFLFLFQTRRKYVCTESSTSTQADTNGKAG